MGLLEQDGILSSMPKLSRRPRARNEAVKRPVPAKISIQKNSLSGRFFSKDGGLLRPDTSGKTEAPSGCHLWCKSCDLLAIGLTADMQPTQALLSKASF